MTAKPPIAWTRAELYRRVWAQPLSVVAKDIGLSGNALAKICNRLLVPCPPRGYWGKVNAGKRPPKEPLPAAPDAQAKSFSVSSKRATSRRALTRLSRDARRDQLVQIAEQLILNGGLSAATMKRIAATAGISETQAYNYFASRELLFVELARREFGRIREVRARAVERSDDHYAQINSSTRAYLRQIGNRGTLLQTLLSSPEVRASLRVEHRQDYDRDVRGRAHELVELYGVSPELALGTTVVLTRLVLRAGKIVADNRIPLESAEKLCIALMLQGSYDLISGGANPSGQRSGDGFTLHER